jgi:hypothetical protein
MAHPCRNNWANSLPPLQQALDTLMTSVPYGGWAYLLVDTGIPVAGPGNGGDFRALRDLYYDLALALDEPTVPAGTWFDPRLLPLVDPRISNRSLIDTAADPLRDFETLAGNFRADLADDGEELEGQMHPEYGMRGWLEMGATDPISHQQAFHLFDRLRHALDR